MMFFENGFFYIWPKENFSKEDIPHIELFKKGTVVINQLLIDSNDKKTETFVACHEAMHWIKDKKFFSDNNKTISQICKNDMKFNIGSKVKVKEGIIERQTNYLSTALLLPKEALRKTFFAILRYKNIPKELLKYEV